MNLLKFGFIILVLNIIVSCKTNNFMKRVIPGSTESSTVGLIIQYNETMDTSEVQHAFIESLTQCGFNPLPDIFKPDIFLSGNFDLLYNADSSFLKNQKSLHNLSQLIVVKLKYVVKQDVQSGKNSVGMTCNARWISTATNTNLHEFYYTEKINAPDNTIGLKEMQSFLGTQIYMKLCLDIQKYILKKN